MKKYECPFGFVCEEKQVCPLGNGNSIMEVSLGISTEDTFNIGIGGAYNTVSGMIQELDLLNELDNHRAGIDAVIFEDMFEEDLLEIWEDNKKFIQIDYMIRAGKRKYGVETKERKREIFIRDREWRRLWKRVSGSKAVRKGKEVRDV